MNYTLRGKIAKAHPYQLDTTLTVEGAGAEAQATGVFISELRNDLENHTSNKANPHNVTKKQIGLEFVDNTSDDEKPVSQLQSLAINEAKQAGLYAAATAQTAAENAQTAADNAQAAADNAQTAANNAQTAADNAQAAAEKALTDSKTYSDGKHLVFSAWIGIAWSETAPYTQQVTIEGILATDLPHVTPAYTADETCLLEKEAWAMISAAYAENSAITFYCFEDKPVTAIPIQIEVNR